MTRRLKLLYLVVSLLIAGAMAFATTASAVKAASHSGKAASCAKRNKATGLVKFSDWEFPDTLNPAQTTLLVSTEIIDATFDSLFQYDNHAKLIPQLATAVPSVKNKLITNGGKTITVHLKPGQRWSDGSAITSADVKFSWKIGMDPDSGPACKGTCDHIARIDTPDKYTDVFHMKDTYAPAVAYAIGGFTLYPHKWSGAWNNDSHAATDKIYQDTKFNFEGPDFPTNGAYQVAPGGFSANDRIVLQPMKYYQDMACGAYVKNLIFVFYSSKPSLIAAASARQTDVTFDYTPADLPTLKQNAGHNYTLHSDPSFTFEHLEFNVDPNYNGKPNPLANAKVRQALALALDKSGVVQSALGINAKSASLIMSWSPLVNTPQLHQPFADRSLNGQWDPLRKVFDPNTGKGKALADAKKLLSQTPFKSGFDLDFFTTSGNPVRAAQEAVIAKDWNALGVNVKPNFVPASKLFGNYQEGGTCATGQFQVAMFAFTGAPDPDQLHFNLQSSYIDREQTVHTSINENYSGIHDKVFESGFKAGSKSFDSKARQKAYSAIQVELNKQAYWIGLYYRPTIATDDGKVKNFSTNPTGAPQWNIYAWQAKS